MRARKRLQEKPRDWRGGKGCIREKREGKELRILSKQGKRGAKMGT